MSTAVGTLRLRRLELHISNAGSREVVDLFKMTEVPEDEM
jgi:hypothetical protein